MPAAGQKQTVLLVDDDANFLSELNDVLVGAGFHVLAAGTGSDAQKIWAANRRRPIDAAVIDLNLPDMAGLELIRRIVTARTTTRVLATTACLSDLHLEIAGYMGAHKTIRKFPETADGFPRSEWVESVSTVLKPDTSG